MKRRLNTTDQLLSHLTQVLNSTLAKDPNDPNDPKDPSHTRITIRPSTQPDNDTSNSLRAHHAMNGAARAWFLGRGAHANTERTKHLHLEILQNDAAALIKAINHYETGRSLLLPAFWVGGLTLGTLSRLVDSPRAQRTDQWIADRARSAHDDTTEILDRLANTTKNEINLACGDNSTDEKKPEQVSTPSQDRRRQYSLNVRRSPSEQLLSSVLKRSTHRLFSLARRI